MLDDIRRQTRSAILQLLEIARPRPQDIVVVGCSSSEVAGQADRLHLQPGDRRSDF